jgi:hypothetical protein
MQKRLKERSKANFQIKNKTPLCDSKIKTQEHRIKQEHEMCKTNVKANL